MPFTTLIKKIFSSCLPTKFKSSCCVYNDDKVNPTDTHHEFELYNIEFENDTKPPSKFLCEVKFFKYCVFKCQKGDI